MDENMERRRTVDEQLEGLGLFESPPDPPTGPQAEAYTREEGRPEAFDRFMATEEGETFWWAIRTAALAALEEGEARFSARAFLSNYRHTRKVRINDHFSPWFADLLVATYPALLDIVERRERKKAVRPPAATTAHPDPSDTLLTMKARPAICRFAEAVMEEGAYSYDDVDALTEELLKVLR